VKKRPEKSKFNGGMQLSPFKIFFSYLLVTILLFGIVFGVKTKEIQKGEYISIGNEYSLLDFGLGERAQQVYKVLEEPVKKGDVLEDLEQKLLVHFSDGDADYFITSNRKFKINKTIKVGDRIEKVVDNNLELDMFQYPTGDSTFSYVYLFADEQSVVFEVNEGKIKRILVSQEEVSIVSLIEAMNKEIIPEESLKLTDEELLEISDKLSFRINLEENNQKVLSGEFQKYLEAGLLPQTPLPIGYSKKNLIGKYGTPVYEFEGNGNIEVIYYYKKFNTFVGYSKEDRLVEVRMPVNIPLDEFERVHSNIENFELDDYKLEIVKENDMVTEVVLKEK
jgi:hypothetical protein